MARGSRRTNLFLADSRFEQHVKGKKAIEKIRERKWDVVVLQEQQPATDPQPGVDAQVCPNSP